MRKPTLNKKSRTRQTILVFGFAVFITALFGAGSAFRAPSLNLDVVDPLKPIVPQDRLLVFAPHCDDEILGAGGLIMQAISQEAHVKIVILTNGDNNIFSTGVEFKTLYPTAGEFMEAGKTRQQESIGALKYIGVPENDIVFLGFPDRGLKALLTKNWLSGRPFRSRGAQNSMASYKIIYERDVVYSGENLFQNIKEIVESFSPTLVAGPHLDDRHPDHKYAAIFINKALGELYGKNENANKPTLLTYLVHYPHYPQKRGLKQKANLLPPFAATFDMQWRKLTLTREDEERKLKALRFHSSQLKIPQLNRLMHSFIRRNELFEEIDISQ